MNPSQQSSKQKQIEKAIKKRLQNMTGAGVWMEVAGQKFTPEEARDAADFWDMMQDYHLPLEYYKDFISESSSTGHHLVAAVKAPIEDLGKILMGCEDQRIIEVVQTRCRKENEDSVLLSGPDKDCSARGNIIVP